MKKTFLPFLLSIVALAVTPAATHAQYITTVAGVGLGDDSLANHAELIGPVGIAIDNAGNTYIAQQSFYTVRKVSAAGIITTFAGTGTYGMTGDGGPATAANIGQIYGIAIDRTGNVYLVDAGNNCIRKVSPAGIISTIAGNSGVAAYSGDGGPATAAELNQPIDAVADTFGNLIFTDFYNSVVRKINPAGIITTIVGDGSTGGTGDGGPATASELGRPFRVALDNKGNLFVAEVANNYICRVDTAGIIKIVGGTGVYGLGTDGDGGQATAATMSAPCGLALDTMGNLFFSDIDNERIRKIDLNTGIISAYAATLVAGYSGDGGPATAAQISTPEDLVCDAAGNLYICDASNNLVRKVSTTGIITSFAGQSGLFGDGQPATSSEITLAYNIATDAGGNVYLADILNNRVRKIDAGSGLMTTVAGTGYAGYGDSFGGDGGPATAALINNPSAVAIDNAGNMYIADNANGRIRKVNAAGIISTIAGNGGPAYNGDNGPASGATLVSPIGVAVDNSGNVFVADQQNSRTRKIDAAGIIHTVAGTGTSGFSGDGGAAIYAKLNAPNDVTVDLQGNLYIADFKNHRIRKVDTAGIIITIAGTGVAGSTGDGGPATDALLNLPAGVKVDPLGNIYIADYGNNKVRIVNTSGVITTAAGNGAAGFSGDGGLAPAAKLYWPTGVALDAANHLFIADAENFRIRKVTYPESVAGVAGRDNGLRVYPNPASDNITVEIEANSVIGNSVRLYNVTGSVVYQSPMILKKQTINISKLPAGTYTLQVGNGKGVAKSIKVVKE
jgi:sugar lactone lactonase YvrE